MSGNNTNTVYTFLSTDDNLIGKTISHYKIIEKLGKGGMGEVYKAEDIKLHRKVALKFILPEYTPNRVLIDKFICEAQTTSALDHQNITTIYEIDESNDGRFFIAMAFYPGETLKHKISKGNLSIKESINIAIQIAEGLTKAHQKDIIHNDIKPANIIIDTEGIVKIIDFGLSKLLSNFKQRHSKNKMGTIPYMAPEALMGKITDFRTDIWSLGVVLYEMLTGQRPFDETFDNELIYSILNEDPCPVREINKEIPRSLENLLLKALQKKRENRYSDMLNMLVALKKIKYKYNYFYDESAFEYYIQPVHNEVQSLAVLPFENLTNDPEQEYFAEGITDELITDLAKILDINVISRTSTFLYKKRNKSITEIADELNADLIVEGSVLRKKEKIQITVQLINASTDTHLWAEIYEREFKDIIILQSQLVEAIAQEIGIKLSQKQKRKFLWNRPINSQQYDNYLKGCFHHHKLSPEHLDKAYEYYRAALNNESNYALAYVGISKVWMGKSYWGIDKHINCMKKARSAVNKALKINDSLWEGHYMLAAIKYHYGWDWKSSEDEFLKSIELNPNCAESHLFYSALLRSLRRDDEAFYEVKRGLELDPLNYFSKCFYVGHLLHVKKFDQAIRKLREILKTEPNFSMAHRYLWVAYHNLKLFDKAVEEARDYFSSLGKLWAADILALKYSKLGYRSVMNILGNEMVQESKKNYVQPIWIARLYAYSENAKECIKWLNIAFKERDPLMVNLNVSRDWDNLRDEPDFKKIITKMKLMSK